MARFLKSAVAIAAVAVAATNAAPLARRDLCPNGFQDLYAITGVVSSLAVSPQRDCHAQDGLNIRNGYEVSTDVSTHVRWRWAGRGAAGAVRARAWHGARAGCAGHTRALFGSGFSPVLFRRFLECN